ncbi:hypothetical protein U1E44_00485 [Arenibacter sp. GZD96]|uniref:hypothetical protein n=1 Tax=Aurantibrevibacter litoralis TaxID=3106030 RepID=UPI002AFED0E2|nr:hypothetical protein [Arenibacter sp. GZD-96]MEA1784555.1 hypothetical protein [Arenibacter sp. GZD-96]
MVQPVKIINELKGKELCIHNLLDKKGSSFVQDLMAKFKGTSEFDIKIVSKEKVFSPRLNAFVNGLTNPIKAGKIEIFISTTNADKNSALEVAHTLVHEYIHADMLRKLNTIAPSILDLNFRQTYEA